MKKKIYKRKKRGPVQAKKVTYDGIKFASEKIQHLVFPNRFTVRPILIYVGELGMGIKDSDFFSEIISFDQLLTIPVGAQ